MNIRNRMMPLSAVALVLAAGTSLSAQVSTGSMNGHVMDASGKPLADARVTFESPALFQTRVLKTDKNGLYRAQLLPVGNYMVKVSAEGYMGKTLADVRVGLGTALSMDFMLKAVKEVSATVEVLANVAQEAKTDDKVSVNYSAEDLLRLPTSRSFDGALSLAPGVSVGDMGLVNIRGAANTENTSASGHANSQVLYHIDGIDVKDDAGVQDDSNASGRATIYEPLEDSIEDVQVVLSALNARNGRTTGGQVNVLTKSGSNTFEGTIRTSINRPSWTTNKSHGPNGTPDAGSFEDNVSNAYSRHTDITFSGPIIKDRLWFYVGTRLQPGRSNGFNTLGPGSTKPVRVDDNFNIVEDLPGTTADYAIYPQTTYGQFPLADAVLTNKNAYPSGFAPYNFAWSDIGKRVPSESKFKKYEGKLTGQVTPDHVLTFTYLYGQETTSGRSGERASGEYSINLSDMGDLKDTTKAWSLTWNGTLASTWFIEAKASKGSREEGDVVGTYRDGRTTPLYAYLGSGDRHTMFENSDGGVHAFVGSFAWERQSASITPSLRENDTLNLNVKHFLDLGGQHEIDFGAENYRSRFQFGRERAGNALIFVGGFIYNKQTGDSMYPTMWVTNDQSLDSINYGALTQWNDDARTAVPVRKNFIAQAGKAKNESISYWVNDTWTINDHWNAMAGLRANRFAIYDTTGPKIVDTSIVEPRFQLKWNPDGSNKRLITFTWAKLASSYSDEIANYLRANSWRLQTFQYWRGTQDFSGQPALDAAGSDSMHGIRWATYGQLTNGGNWGPATRWRDISQTNDASKMVVPYAIEMSLGYTRNYDTGHASISLVQRTYKKTPMAFVHSGLYDPNDPTKYLVLTHNPDPNDTAGQDRHMWFQRSNFINSDLDKVYRSVEISWDKQATSRIKVGGNAVYSQMTGYRDLDNYLWRDAKIQYLGAGNENQWAPEGLLSRDLRAKVFITYVYPLPNQGNLSASVLATYAGGGASSLTGISTFPGGMPNVPSYMDAQGHPSSSVQSGYYPVVSVDSTAAYNQDYSYNVYYSPRGALKTGNDYYGCNLRLQAQIPLAGKIKLTSYLQVDNVFNRISKESIYGWNTDVNTGGSQSSNAPVNGRPLASFNLPWGYAKGSNYYTSGRTYTEFSVGLKF